MNPAHTSAAPTLTIRRTFSAPRARVFTALTDVAQIRQWFAPDGGLVDARWDARVGGTYRVAMMVSETQEYVVTGVFSDVSPPERLAFSFRWLEDDPADERDTFVTIELHDRGPATELVFHQTSFRDEPSRDSHAHGWNRSLANLERLCTTPPA